MAFMLLFGINFNLFYFILIKKAKEAFKSEELRWYIIIVAVATLTIAVNILNQYENISVALRYAFFQVSSIITTTGYGTADFALWPAFSQSILVMLMIIGACAGSTGGGLKISRVILLFKTFAQEMKHLLHPRAVTTVRLENSAVDNSIVRNTLVYFSLYVFITIICIYVAQCIKARARFHLINLLLASFLLKVLYQTFPVLPLK